MKIVIIEEEIFKITNKLYIKLKAYIELYEEINQGGFLNSEQQKVYDKRINDLENILTEIRNKYIATEIDTAFRF